MIFKSFETNRIFVLFNASHLCDKTICLDVFIRDLPEIVFVFSWLSVISLIISCFLNFYLASYDAKKVAK